MGRRRPGAASVPDRLLQARGRLEVVDSRRRRCDGKVQGPCPCHDAHVGKEGRDGGGRWQPATWPGAQAVGWAPSSVQAGLSHVLASGTARDIRACKVRRFSKHLDCACRLDCGSIREPCRWVAAAREVRRRSGSYLDPQLADAFASQTDHLLEGLGDIDAYQPCVGLRTRSGATRDRRRT